MSRHWRGGLDLSTESDGVLPWYFANTVCAIASSSASVNRAMAASMRASSPALSIRSAAICSWTCSGSLARRFSSADGGAEHPPWI